MINIADIDKACLFAALFNTATARGVGIFDDDGSLSVAEARDYIATIPSLYFDYVNGRPLKMDLSGDEFDEHLYDRDQGDAAARAVALARALQVLPTSRSRGVTAR